MGLTANVVANAPILSSWGNEIRDRTVQVFATAAERSAQWTSPPVGAVSWLTSPGALYVFNTGGWVCVTPASQLVTTSGTTTSAAWVDLASAGPTVTVQTGAKALVTLSAITSTDTINQGATLSVAVSGASTIAAPAGTFTVNHTSAAANAQVSVSGQFLLSGLTPGSNVFTMKYARLGSGTATFFNRSLTVVGIP